ncbi:hypothetical protein Fot_53377 [Forsythia ovata]|uniref:Uncharacterized protein n=1 Tax=Forsythia ovata TaxID=205694 RepID=A0ABD1PMB2_9LAMI
MVASDSSKRLQWVVAQDTVEWPLISKMTSRAAASDRVSRPCAALVAVSPDMVFDFGAVDGDGCGWALLGELIEAKIKSLESSELAKSRRNLTDNEVPADSHQNLTGSSRFL